MRRIAVLAFLSLFALPLFATESNPSARQRELIGQILQSMNVDRMSKSLVDSMYSQIERQFLQQAQAHGNDPDSIAESQDMFRSFRDKCQTINFAELLREEQIRIYARYFTEQELSDLVAFYNSPTGKKLIEVSPQIMSDGMKAGVEKVTPRLHEMMQQVTEEQEKKHPWRRTMSDMRRIGSALEAYTEEDHDDDAVPRTGNVSTLIAALKATDKFPMIDIWGHPYEYVISPDGQHYRIVSAGADGIFEWDSRTIDTKSETGRGVRYRDRLEDDLIYADGAFVQLPLQARPKDHASNAASH